MNLNFMANKELYQQAIFSVVSEYRHQKTTSNNTKAFVHILVNFFSCALTRLSWKFKFEILAETPKTKRKKQKRYYKARLVRQ